MWQQVSGQINTRFPGFLLCGNPQAVLAVDPGEAWDHVFLLCFFFFSCTREYDSIGHKLITFTKMRIPHHKALSSHLSYAATPTARPREVRWAEFTWRCWRKTADDLQLESCETQLLAHGTQMIRVLSVPFAFGVSVKHFTSRGCFFKRSLPHFPADFTHPIKS